MDKMDISSGLIDIGVTYFYATALEKENIVDLFHVRKYLKPHTDIIAGIIFRIPHPEEKKMSEESLWDTAS